MSNFSFKFKSHHSSSSGNLYTLTGFKTKIMIECGVPMKKIEKAVDHDLSSFDGCIVSHKHFDHSKSLHNIAVRGVDVYALKETLDEFPKHHRYHEIKQTKIIDYIPLYKTFEIGEFKITPFHASHDVPNVGFMISSSLSNDKLLFLIDTFFSHFTFPDITHFAIEVNHSEELLRKAIERTENNFHLKRLWNSHFSLERACNLLDSNDMSKVREIHLTHLSSGNGDGTHFKQVIENRYNISTFVCEA